MAMTSTPALAVAFPRFAVFRYVNEGSFAGLVTSTNVSNANVTTKLDDEHQLNSLSVKFELEVAKNAGNEGLVHIRSCKNNKYWARSNESIYITVSAKEPEEDISKEYSTLFEFEQAEEGNVRLKHVGTGYYACAWFTGGVQDGCLIADYKVHDVNKCDIFTLNDWESYLFLPRYVAFKADNGRYLRVVVFVDDEHPYMQFQGTDTSNENVPLEIISSNDGTLRFRPTSNEKFWMLSPSTGWIWANSTDQVGQDRGTLFAGYKVDKKTVAIKCLANDSFLVRLSKDRLTDCLNADSLAIVDSSKFDVEEPVKTRNIQLYSLYLENARIYNVSIIRLAQTTARNDTSLDQTVPVTIPYEDSRSMNWIVNCSVNLRVMDDFNVNIPTIRDNVVVLKREWQKIEEWGTPYITTSTADFTHQVHVPGKSTVEVNLLATKGFCDVPFSITQKDVLYNGTEVTTKLEGNFIGWNYYNYNIVTSEAKPSPSKN